MPLVPRERSAGRPNDRLNVPLMLMSALPVPRAKSAGRPSDRLRVPKIALRESRRSVNSDGLSARTVGEKESPATS